MPDIPTAVAGPVRSGPLRSGPRRGPLDGVAPIDLPGAVSVAVAGPLVRLVLRSGPAAAEAAGVAFGVALPQEACRAATAADGWAALWLGPDEWLLLMSEDGAVAATVAMALQGQPCSLVDVSHRQLALVLDGPRAAELLNAACPLDLAIEAFPPGTCTRTVLGKTEIVLWRTGALRFHMEIWRSYAAYGLALLREAAEMLPIRPSVWLG